MPTSRTRFVRHRQRGYDLEDFLRKGWLDDYQGFQDERVFHEGDYVVSFIGTTGSRARFLGVYGVSGCRPGAEGHIPEGCLHSEWLNLPYFFEMHRVDGYEDLEHRVIIEWGKGARSWSQRPRPKEVVEILPEGERLRPFDDYLSFTLTHGELRYLSSEPAANTEWRARLSAVAGIYLILAETTGAQYVGSAHGVDGFWGRWQAYAQNGHGGNRRLQELIEQDPAYPEKFSYSILQIVPPTTVHSEVLKLERLYKQKLGSRAIGLNDN